MQPFSATENSSFIITNGSQRDSRKFCQDLAEYFNVSFLYETRDRRCTLRRGIVLQNQRLWTYCDVLFGDLMCQCLYLLMSRIDWQLKNFNKDKLASYRKIILFVENYFFLHKWKKGIKKILYIKTMKYRNLTVNDWKEIEKLTLENFIKFEISSWKQLS